MHCFIIAALSADGYIGRDSAHAAMWTSKEDKKRFVELTRRSGVIVMGRNTWTTLGGKPLKDRLNIVYTKSDIPIVPGMEKTDKDPHNLLRDLEVRGFKEVAICGGSQIYTLFMKAGLVDTLYLTIEPIVFGSGLKLFDGALDCKLELVSQSKTDKGTIMLEYKVVR